MKPLRMTRQKMLPSVDQRIFGIRKLTQWREILEQLIMRVEQSGLTDKILLAPITFDMRVNPNLRSIGDDEGKIKLNCFSIG